MTTIMRCCWWLAAAMMCQWWHWVGAASGELITKVDEPAVGRELADPEPSVVATEVMIEVVCSVTNQTNCTSAVETLEPIFAGVYVDALGVTADLVTVDARCLEDHSGVESDRNAILVDILVTIPSDVSQNLTAYNLTAVKDDIGTGEGQSNPEDYFSDTVQIITLNVARNAGVLTPGVLDNEVTEALVQATVELEVIIESVSTPAVVVQTTVTSSSSSTTPSSSTTTSMSTSTSTSRSTRTSRSSSTTTSTVTSTVTTTSTSTTSSTITFISCSASSEATPVANGTLQRGSARFRFCPEEGSGTFGLTVETMDFSPRLDVLTRLSTPPFTQTRVGARGNLVLTRSGVCHDITVSARGSPNQVGDFSLVLTCCVETLEEEICSGRSGHRFWHWLPPVYNYQPGSWNDPEPYQCACQYCVWPYRGPKCQQCWSGYLPVTDPITGEVTCVNCRGRWVYGLSVGGGSYEWKLELPSVCEDQVVLRSVVSPWTPDGTKELPYSADGIRVDMPDCEPRLRLWLSISWSTSAQIDCVALPSCPASLVAPSPATADELMKRNSTVHIHLLQTTFWTGMPTLSMQVLGLVIDAAGSKLAPVILDDDAEIVWSTEFGVLELGRAGDLAAEAASHGSNGTGRTVAMAAVQDHLNERLRSNYGSGRWCGFSQQEKDALLMPDGSVDPGKLIIFVGDRSDCWWLGDEIANLKRSPSVYSITRSSSQLATEMCSTLTWLDTLARVSLAGPDCVNSDQAIFFPTTARAMRRTQLTFTGICGIQACCFGSVCSQFVSNEGGLTTCWTPLLTRLGEHPVTVITLDGQNITTSQPLNVLAVGNDNGGIHLSRWGSRGWLWRSGASRVWCTQWVAIGVGTYEVLGALADPSCSRSNWRSLSSVPQVNHDMPFTRPVGVVALRTYTPRDDPLGNGLVDGRSSDKPAVETTYQSMTSYEVGIAPERSWYGESKIQGYVNYLTSFASSSPSGIAMEAVRKALAEQGLYSTYPPEERTCEDSDTPDAAGKCHWAWSKNAGGAANYLMSAGFRCREVGWQLFDSIAVLGDIIVLPPFEAVNPAKGESASMPYGDIAVKHGVSWRQQGWVSDAYRNFVWLDDMNVTVTPPSPLDTAPWPSYPSLCRLQHNAGLWPEEDEIMTPYAAGQEILYSSSTTAAVEAFATRLASDVAIPDFEEVIQETRSAYKCPRFWGATTIMPRELNPRASIFWSRAEFRCLTMFPDARRAGGVSCCYNRQGFYVPEFPSATSYGAGPTMTWRRFETEGFAKLATTTVRAYDAPPFWASILDPCKRISDPDMCLPRPDLKYEMACLADGAKFGTASCASLGAWRVLDNSICPSGHWGYGEDCLVVYARGADECSIAFPGHNRMWDWTDMLNFETTDFEYWQQPSTGRPALKVHKGLYEEYHEYRVDKLGMYLQHSQCSKATYMVGFSEGAALATLLFLDMGVTNPNVHLHAFGAPRLLYGDISQLSFDRAWRYALMSSELTYTTDPVTFLAPSTDWHSFGTPVFIEKSARPWLRWTVQIPDLMHMEEDGDTIVRLDNTDINDYVAQCLPLLPNYDMKILGSQVCPACGVVRSLHRTFSGSGSGAPAGSCLDLLGASSSLVASADELHSMAEYVSAFEHRWCGLREDNLVLLPDAEKMCAPRPPDGTNSPFLPGSRWTPRRPPFFGWGDPHCSSIDGKEFECNFLGEAIYASCPGYFRVHVATIVVGEGGGTAINAVAIEHGDDILTITPRPADAIDADNNSTDNSTNSSELEVSNTSNSTNDVDITSLYIMRLNGEESEFEVDSPDFSMVAEIDTENNIITIEDRDKVDFEVRLTLRRTFMSPVEVTPWQDACYGKMEGLVGNGNGDATDDFLPRHETEPLPAESSCRELYDGFVMSWCVTASNDSLLGEDYLCNETYSPICIDEVEETILETCPASCSGRLNCCFDNNVAGDAFLEANIEDVEALELERATSLAVGETPAPQFLTDITSITLLPLSSILDETPDRFAVFEAFHQVAVTDLTCSICNSSVSPEEAAALEGYRIDCNVTGLGNTTARLELTALSLPSGTFSCTASEASGKFTEIFVDVIAIITQTTTSTMSSTSTGTTLSTAMPIIEEDENTTDNTSRNASDEAPTTTSSSFSTSTSSSLSSMTTFSTKSTSTGTSMSSKTSLSSSSSTSSLTSGSITTSSTTTSSSSASKTSSTSSSSSTSSAGAADVAATQSSSSSTSTSSATEGESVLTFTVFVNIQGFGAQSAQEAAEALSRDAVFINALRDEYAADVSVPPSSVNVTVTVLSGAGTLRRLADAPNVRIDFSVTLSTSAAEIAGEDTRTLNVGGFQTIVNDAIAQSPNQYGSTTVANVQDVRVDDVSITSLSTSTSTSSVTSSATSSTSTSSSGSSQSSKSSTSSSGSSRSSTSTSATTVTSVTSTSTAGAVVVVPGGGGSGDDSSGADAGLIVALVAAIVVAVILAVVLFMVLCYVRRRNHSGGAAVNEEGMIVLSSREQDALYAGHEI